MPKITGFGLNSAKAYIGQTVNLHLKDGGAIANVKVLYVINRKLIYKINKNKVRTHPLAEIAQITPFLVIIEW